MKTKLQLAASLLVSALSANTAYANNVDVDVAVGCTVPSPDDETPFKTLQECLKTLDARGAALDAKIAESADEARSQFEAEKKLNAYASAALKAYADAVAALGSNRTSQKDVSDRITTLQSVAARADDRQKAALAAVERDENARLDVLRTEETSLREKAEKARPAAVNYVAAVFPSRVDLPPEPRPTRSASADCAQMVQRPQLSLKVSNCAAEAIGSFAGGSVQVPGSILHPRGFSAFLSGSDTSGTLGITYAREFKRRLPVATEQTAQSFIRPGFSLGMSTGGGSVFKSDDKKDFLDSFDGKLTFKGSLFLHFYDAQLQQSWQTARDKLQADAVKACLEDQAKPVPSFRSTCADQSLTDWVYAPADGKNGLKHEELAKRTNALYFGSDDLVPRWGFGVEGAISRPSAEYLRKGGFKDFFKGAFDETFEDAALIKDREIAWSVTPYVFRRLGDGKTGITVVGVGSFSIAQEFGFDADAVKTTFCPAIDTSAPFSLGKCKSYFEAEPTDRMVYTPAIELRFLFGGNGWRPTAAVSPRVSYASTKATPSGDPDRWTLSVPALVFVDDELKTGLGIKVDHSWGGTRLDAATAALIKKDPETVVSLVVSKTLSLTSAK